MEHEDTDTAKNISPDPQQNQNALSSPFTEKTKNHSNGKKSQLRVFFSEVWALKAPLMVIISVLGTLPLLLLVPTTEGRCAYVLIVMAILWLTEAIPIPVTSLFPVFMFPMTGVLPAADTANSYMGKTSLLFIGGLLVAIAVEETNLHRRLALNVLKIVGSDPKWLMLGLMLPTWFLSMWISNTATASMMVPIVEAILEQLKDANNESNTDISSNHLAQPPAKKMKKKNKRYEVVEAKTRIREYGVYRQNSESSSNSDEQVSVSPESATMHLQEYGVTFVPGTKLDTHKTSSDSDISDVTFELGTNTNRTSNGDLSNGTSNPSIQEDDIEQGKSSRAKLEPGANEAAADDDEYKRICKAFLLSIAYAANTGGIATLTGTPPNLVFSGQAVRLYEKYDGEPGVTFLNWMLMVLPLAIILLVLTWLWLGLFFLRLRFFKHDVSRKKAVQSIIHKEYEKIGKLSFAELSTLVLFILLALLWLSRQPEFVEGWSELFIDSYVDDSTCAVLIGCLFFVLPSKRPRVFCWRRPVKEGSEKKPRYTPLLTWKVAQRKMPWGIIVLLGGGFAVAKACTQSGLSDWLGEQLTSLDSLEPWLLNLVICTIVAMATEVTSNTATATLLMPVTFELAVKLQVNPLYLMSSTALATSFAFMMPVATPPNAIVFASGRLTIPDMASAGAVMNILAVLALTLCVNTWGSAMYDFDILPEVFRFNTTALSTS